MNEGEATNGSTTATEPQEDVDFKIIHQIEYYFGDYNLPRDKFLQEEINKDYGWIPLGTMLNFKRLAALSIEKEVIVNALGKSEQKLIEISEDKSKIRRAPDRPLPIYNDVKAETMKCTVYCKGFPKDGTVTLDVLLKYFQNYGPYESVLMRYYTDEKKPGSKGSVLVVFPSEEKAKEFMDLEEVKYENTSLIRKWHADYIEEKQKEVEERKAKRNANKKKDGDNEVVNKCVELEKTPLQMRKNEICPLKVFVGNLRQNVNKDKLLETLTPHANVTKVSIVKKTFRGPDYGFVSVSTENDVEKILDLNYQDCYLYGSKLIFQPAYKRSITPGNFIICKLCSERVHNIKDHDHYHMGVTKIRSSRPKGMLRSQMPRVKCRIHGKSCIYGICIICEDGFTIRIQNFKRISPPIVIVKNGKIVKDDMNLGYRIDPIYQLSHEEEEREETEESEEEPWEKELIQDCGQHQIEKNNPLETPDKIDPLKLFVGNLRKNVKEDQLLATLIPHANVTSAFIIKRNNLIQRKETSKDKNYGFVSLPTEDDLKKIIDLNNQDCFLSGSKLIFRPAHKHLLKPGEVGFLRQPLSDRAYDLTPLDPNKPSVHVLVDDIIMQIFEYLPLKERILCEIVCRRWQALLYILFESTHLNLNQNYFIKNSLNISKKHSKAMLSKMLLLSGETLKSFSLSNLNNPYKPNYISVVEYYIEFSEIKHYLDFSEYAKKTLLLIIAQLCPNLEYLDLTKVPVYFDNVKDLKDCKNLKSVSFPKCLFNENQFKELISVLPCLDKINVSYTSIIGHCFNLLPKGLKELNISFCRKLSKENLHKVSNVCKYLEVIEIEKLDADKEFLEELGVNCKNLRCLKWLPSTHPKIDSLPDYTVDVSKQVKVFTKLTSLKIVASVFELSNIADNVKNLKELHIQMEHETTNMVDFGKFTRLKNVILISSPFRKQELMSLAKCRNLQYVTLVGCYDADQEIIKNIIRGCPEIKHIECPIWAPNGEIDMKFITDINEIMKNRSELIKIAVYKRDLTTRLLLEAQYDTNKIEFDFVDHVWLDEDYIDDVLGHLG